MPITLVDGTIIKRYEVDGSTFLYKEILPRDLEKLYQKFQTIKKNEFIFDIFTLKEAVLDTYITGWENVNTTDGVSIPYKSEYLAGLPSEIRNNLYTLITSGKLPEVPVPQTNE